MRVLLFGNGRIASEIARELRLAGDTIVGLVRHPAARARNAEELARAAEIGPDAILDGSTLRSSDTLSRLRAAGAEIGVAAYFGYILAEEVLAIPPRGVVNVHPGLLPFNRGAYPNVWSILDRTPAGVTMHWMDRGVDTGPIIAQHPVAVAPADTGESLYRKLESAALELFRETWPAIRAGTCPSRVQPQGGTVHRSGDVNAVDRIELDREYRARDLIDLLRARTFPPHRGAYFEEAGRRIYLRLELESVDMIDEVTDHRSAEPAMSRDRQ